MTSTERLLLLSSSRVHGSGLLEHAEEEIRTHLESVRSILFIPYALKNMDEYAATYLVRFQQLGFKLSSIHASNDPVRSVENAEALFVGGGNTFRLLKALYEKNLLNAIRQRVRDGMPYMGSSAGTNIVAPTIRTTNDMPIVEPPSLSALNLISFQINPHYQDADPNSTHMGETREERLIQYLEENEIPVIGLREPGMLRIRDGSIVLAGNATARLFIRGKTPEEILAGSDLNDYL